jgi:hypothetical protein
VQPRVLDPVTGYRIDPTTGEIDAAERQTPTPTDREERQAREAGIYERYRERARAAWERQNSTGVEGDPGLFGDDLVVQSAPVSMPSDPAADVARDLAWRGEKDRRLEAAGQLRLDDDIGVPPP